MKPRITEKMIENIFWLLIMGMCVVPYIFEWPRARTVKAEESSEVKPYCFATLPHGQIYKAVHEGCELYITEANDQGPNGVTYTIATGRGCK